MWTTDTSWNIKLGIFWTAVETASSSIRSGDVLSGYIFLLTQDNAVVGFVQGINGVLQLCVAFPAGWLADHWRRDCVLRLAAAIGAAAGASLLYTIFFQEPVAFIFTSMALMGAYRGVYSPALESIYADSVPTGRSELYTAKHIAMQLASCFGPLLSVVAFLILGNTWKVSECRTVLLAGVGLMLAPIISMCFFSDNLTLGAASDAVRSKRAVIKASSGVEVEDQQMPGCCSPCCCITCNQRFLVASSITFSDLLGALASGMTVKFFSLFFMQVCAFRPVAVSLLGVASPLGISAASVLAQAASRWLGRAQTTLLTRLADILLLVAMAFTPPGSTGRQAGLVAMHLVRTAMANCTRPLLRSLLMDHVPKRHRGKVNALDSVRTLSWSGSAALGGCVAYFSCTTCWAAPVVLLRRVMVDKFCVDRLLVQIWGFQTTFLVTATIKLLSWLPLMALLCVISEGPCSYRRPEYDHDQDSRAYAPADGGEDAFLRAPLLDGSPDAVGPPQDEVAAAAHAKQAVTHPISCDCCDAETCGVSDSSHAQAARQLGGSRHPALSAGKQGCSSTSASVQDVAEHARRCAATMQTQPN